MEHFAYEAIQSSYIHMNKLANGTKTLDYGTHQGSSYHGILLGMRGTYQSNRGPV